MVIQPLFVRFHYPLASPTNPLYQNSLGPCKMSRIFTPKILAGVASRKSRQPPVATPGSASPWQRFESPSGASESS